MKRIINLALAATLTLMPALVLTGCGDGWETVTSGGIAIESVERDADGYIVEEAVKQAALMKAEITDEALCTFIDAELDKSADPVVWVVNFDADGISYHYVVNAENGDLVTFSSLGL